MTMMMLWLSSAKGHRIWAPRKYFCTLDVGLKRCHICGVGSSSTNAPIPSDTGTYVIAGSSEWARAASTVGSVETNYLRASAAWLCVKATAPVLEHVPAGTMFMHAAKAKKDQ